MMVNGLEPYSMAKVMASFSSALGILDCSPPDTGQFTWQDGSKYDGEWQDGKMHGRGYQTSRASERRREGGGTARRALLPVSSIFEMIETNSKFVLSPYVKDRVILPLPQTNEPRESHVYIGKPLS